MHNPDLRRFDALIFDMGDILYDASAWRRWLAEELQRFNAEVSYPSLVKQWEALLVDVYKREADYWERFDELLRVFDVPPDAVDAVTEAARRKASDVQKDRVPIDGVYQTLSALRGAGIRMAVLSDTESSKETVGRMLRDLDLEEFFDAVVTSADIGHVKPNPEAFHASVAALDTPKHRCAFVGHDVDELEGAQQAGLFAIAFNYDPAAPADVYLDQFAELQQAVLGESAWA